MKAKLPMNDLLKGFKDSSVITGTDEQGRTNVGIRVDVGDMAGAVNVVTHSPENHKVQIEATDGVVTEIFESQRFEDRDVAIAYGLGVLAGRFHLTAGHVAGVAA